MVEVNVLDLVDKNLVTNAISLHVVYSKDVIKPTNVSMKLDEYTNSYAKLNEYFIRLFNKSVDKYHMIRKMGIAFGNVIDEQYKTINLFTDNEEEEKERKVQKAILEIKHKYGKNSILKAMNLQEKATTQKRNKLVGGHNGE